MPVIILTFLIILKLQAEPAPTPTLINSGFTTGEYHECWINAEKITADNFRDICIYSHDDGNLMYITNDGSGGFPAPPYVVFGSNGGIEADFGELNPYNLHKEIAVASYYYWSTHYGVKIYQVNINNALVLFQTIDIDPDIDFLHCDWGRVNGDNYDDLICAGNNGGSNIYGFINDDGMLPTTQESFVVDVFFYNNIIKLVELDNTFDNPVEFDEIVCGSNNGGGSPYTIEIFKNINGAFYLTQTINIDDNNGSDYDIELGDIDGDGDNDLVCCFGSNLYIFSNIGWNNIGDRYFDDDAGDYQIIDNWPFQNKVKIALGEFNYDGYPDLAVGPQYYPYIEILESNGDGTFNEVPSWIGAYPIPYWDYNEVYHMEFADLHGKGGQSLIVSGNSLYLSTPLYYFTWYYSNEEDEPPCPPRNFQVNEDPVSHHPVLNWDFNTEDDIFQYKVYRNITLPHQSTPDGWEEIATRSSSQNSYTDDEIYIVGQNDFAVIEYYVTALDLLGDPTSLESDPSEIIDLRATYHPSASGPTLAASAVTDFSLAATPNPFNNHTSLKLNIPETGMVSLKLYDISGREVTSIYEGYISAGTQEMNFDASALSSGIYFARMSGGKKQAVVKLVLVK